MGFQHGSSLGDLARRFRGCLAHCAGLAVAASLLTAGQAFAQNVRYDAQYPSIVTGQSTPYLVANIPPNSPKLAVCTVPANGVPCTNYATTYNSQGVACPNGAQDTPQPQPSACQPTGDAQGNIGFWAPAGSYDYTVCIGTSCFGPYRVTLGGSGGSGIELQTNGTNNGSQTKLNLTGTGTTTVTDNGSGTVTINSTGTGGGGITGTLTNNFVPKATSTGTNGTVGNSSVQEIASTNSVPVINVPRLEQVRYTDNFIWSQNPNSPSSIAPGSNVITIVCPYGIDATLPDYWIDIGTTGTAEAAPVTATSCTAATVGSSGTITVTARNTHAAGYSVGTASNGAQEAINDGLVTSSSAHNVKVVLPCGANGATIAWDAPVETHGNHVFIEGGGCARILQTHRQAGLILGNRTAGGTFFFNTVHALQFQPGYAGTAPQVNLITSMSRTGCPSACVATFNFGSSHDLLVGDWVIVGGNLNDNTFAGDYQIATVPSGTQVTATPLSNAANNPATVYAGGYVIEQYIPILDNLTIEGYNDQVSLVSTSGLTRPYVSGEEVLADQSANILQFSNSGSGAVFMTPTDEFQPKMIFSPGPNSPSGAVAFIYGANMSMQNTGDCIDWQSGDDLFITDGVCQGFVKNGIRFSQRRGGFGAFSSKGLHYEGSFGGVTQGMTATGYAGLLDVGGTSEVASGENSAPYGGMPLYATVGNALLNWFYYVQPIASTSDPMCSSQPPDGTTGVTNLQRCALNLGTGPVLFAGWAQVDSSSGGTVPVTFNAIPGATSYKLLRTNGPTSGNFETAPYGTGNYLIATVNPLSSCTDAICTVSDSVGLTPSSYTVPTYGLHSYYPYLAAWPGAVVISNNSDAGGTGSASVPNGSYFGPYNQGGNNAPIITTTLPSQDAVILNNPITGAVVGASSPLQGSPFAWRGGGFTSSGNQALPGWATLVPAKNMLVGDGGTLTNLKGLFNFGTTLSPTAPFDLITFYDAAYAKTLATYGHRPSNDAGDCAIGMDVTQAGLSIRCNTSIGFYVNHVNDGSNWKAQVNANGIQTKPGAFSTLATCNSGLEGARAAVTDSTTATFGATISGSGSNHVPAYCNGTNWVVQ